MNRRLHHVTLDPRDSQDGEAWGRTFPHDKRDNGINGGISQVNLASEFERQVPGLRGLAQRHVRVLMKGRQQFGPVDFLEIDAKDTVLLNIPLREALENFNIQVPKNLGAEFYAQTLTTITPREGRRLYFVAWVRGDEVKRLGHFDEGYDHWRVPINQCGFPDELFEIFRRRYPNV